MTITYALVTNDAIQSLGRLPNSARRLDTGEWVMGLATAPVAMQQACGWFEVADTARPADTATTTFDRAVELVNGTPTVVWTERAKTQVELDAQAQAEQDAETRFILQQAVPTLRQWAIDAETTTATSGNAVNVLNVTLDRLAVFFDRFADLLEHQYGD